VKARPSTAAASASFSFLCAVAGGFLPLAREIGEDGFFSSVHECVDALKPGRD